MKCLSLWMTSASSGQAVLLIFVIPGVADTTPEDQQFFVERVAPGPSLARGIGIVEVQQLRGTCALKSRFFSQIGACLPSCHAPTSRVCAINLRHPTFSLLSWYSQSAISWHGHIPTWDGITGFELSGINVKESGFRYSDDRSVGYSCDHFWVVPPLTSLCCHHYLKSISRLTLVTLSSNLHKWCRWIFFRHPVSESDGPLHEHSECWMLCVPEYSTFNNQLLES